MVELTIMDSVWTRTNLSGFEALNNLLSFDDFYWRKSCFGSEKVINKVYCIEDHGNGEYFFLTGFVEKCTAALDRWKIPYKLENLTDEVDVWNPKIEGFTFRDYQEDMINKAIDSGRGIILSPTGTGKSIILLGIMSAFPESNIVFLVHTNDLVKQLRKDITKAFPKEKIGEYSGGKKDLQRITLATVQTWHKCAVKFADWAEVIIVDECHHVSDFYGMYGKVLMNSMALTKIGLTGTIGATNKARMAAEGLLGPIIAEMKIQDAMDKEIVLRPDILLYTNPYLEMVNTFSEYEDIYNMGITNNHIRNMKILTIAKELINSGKTCLIIISKIEHGENLKKIADDWGMNIPFVYGKSSSSERSDVINGLKTGEVPCAISSTIFVEGIDIPALDSLINAAAGRSTIQAVQKVGRALRKKDGKTNATIVDFIDKIAPTLERQSQARADIYRSRGYKIIKKK